MAEVKGYIVAGYEHGVLVVDWDCTVYTTREAGERSLSQCHADGYEDWELYELRAVRAPAAPSAPRVPQPGDRVPTEDEATAEPDPSDPSTWRRYVDSDGDEWYEFAPGRVCCGSRDVVAFAVMEHLAMGGDPIRYAGDLDVTIATYGLRLADHQGGS